MSLATSSSCPSTDNHTTERILGKQKQTNKPPPPKKFPAKKYFMSSQLNTKGNRNSVPRVKKLCVTSEKKILPMCRRDAQIHSVPSPLHVNAHVHSLAWFVPICVHFQALKHFFSHIFWGQGCRLQEVSSEAPCFKGSSYLRSEIGISCFSNTRLVAQTVKASHCKSWELICPYYASLGVFGF